MKKKYRLKKNNDFKKVLNSKRIFGDFFNFYYKKNDFEFPRVGISIGKKIAKANKRNKIKRQLKEIIRDNICFDKGVDIVIIVKDKYNTNDFLKTYKKILEVLEKIEMRRTDEKI